ncbi:Integral membrane protein (intg_mem_TP0381) [Alkalibacterium subtropicum]|uniref:Integral membrane protein (Intg_mem_TP0381) n=1 Tax=Alkalibacterium subtropicum TaxID=753702 RepID=A0A1I1FS84_9LACT|nr:YwaF family protein [Alkalibacterium subtropicum]SFC02165.1 Integral membrane protein (intg_mem_TP0381) [Alkalibacterium subtropicum]
MQMQFEMWSAFHYFMVVFPFVVGVVLYKLTQDKPFTVKRYVAIAMGITLVGILATRQVYIFSTVGLGPEVFPFHVSHFANILLLIVAINPNFRVINAIAWCLTVPAGLAAVIFAGALETYSNVLSIRGLAYVSGHMLIVATGLYLLLTEMIRIDRRALLKAYAITVPLYVLSVIVNKWFTDIFNERTNYFFTNDPGAAAPLKYLYNLGSAVTVSGMTFNPVYLLSLAIIGAMVMFLMYLLAKLRYVRKRAD